MATPMPSGAKPGEYDAAVYDHALALARRDPAAVLVAFLDAQPLWWSKVKNGMAQRTAAPLKVEHMENVTITLGGRRAMTVQRDAAGAIVGATAEEVTQ